MKDSKIKEILSKWGLSGDVKSFEDSGVDIKWGPRNFLNQWIDEFPKDNNENPVLFGNPHNCLQCVNIIVYQLVKHSKIKRRVKIIDVPHLLLSRFIGEDVEENVFISLREADLIIFRDIDAVEWTNTQKAKLFALINERYHNHLPFIATLVSTPEDLESNIGNGLYFRLSSCSTFVGV